MTTGGNYEKWIDCVCMNFDFRIIKTFIIKIIFALIKHGQYLNIQICASGSALAQKPSNSNFCGDFNPIFPGLRGDLMN